MQKVLTKSQSKVKDYLYLYMNNIYVAMGVDLSKILGEDKNWEVNKWQ